MNQPLRHPLIDLPRGATLRVADGRAHVVAVFEGQVWLTQDGDPRDVILEAGDSFAFDSPGLVLVQAFRGSRLLVSDAALEAPALPFSAHELHRMARAQRDAAVGAFIARALAAAESTVAGWLERLAVRARQLQRTPLHAAHARG